MKKVVLTVAALLVSAAMVFSFAGCTETPVDNEGESVAATEEAESAAPVVEAEVSSVLA